MVERFGERPVEVQDGVEGARVSGKGKSGSFFCQTKKKERKPVKEVLVVHEAVGVAQLEDVLVARSLGGRQGQGQG